MDPQLSAALAAAGVPASYIFAAGVALALLPHLMAILPPPATAGSFYGAVYAVLNRIAGNYGRATNATTPASGTPTPPVAVLALLAVGLTLAACSAAVPPAPKTPEQAIYETGAALDVAVKQAAIYAGLPRCGSAGAGVACSDAKAVAVIDDAATRANAAYQAARNMLTVYRATGAGDIAGAAANAVSAVTDLQTAIKGVQK